MWNVSHLKQIVEQNDDSSNDCGVVNLLSLPTSNKKALLRAILSQKAFRGPSKEIR